MTPRSVPTSLSARVLCALQVLCVGGALAASTAAQAPDQPPSAQVRQLVHQAKEELAAGRPKQALRRAADALEREPRNLDALRVDADAALALDDKDRAVHSMHLWLDIVDAARKRPITAKARKTGRELLLGLDPEADTWANMQRGYVRELMQLAKAYRKKKDLIAALEVYAHVLEVDPSSKEAPAAIASIRRTGGSEVAVEDVYAGADPLLGMTPEQLAKANAQHADWDTAWRKQTDNYKYRTDAGFLVLETSAIAMEQMNRFYRKFFRFKEDGGKTPKIEVRIFKNKDEYLKLGSSPVEWSAGQFTGSAVETYAGGVSGKESVRSMYGTLFHEAAHQFVSLTGPFVPGWLNEAYASFFEGCVILSNGSVRWNRAPAHRLFPLAKRLDAGWMEDAEDGVRGADGGWGQPTRAPRVRTIVGGGYAWGPPWYAPTWGLVYFLYNYRSEDGRPVYRDALHAYYQAFERGRPNDPIANFEEIVLRGAKLSPVQSIEDLDPIFKKWILALRDRESGKSKDDGQLQKWGDAALERDDLDLALEMYEAALADAEGDLTLLTKLARLHEQRKEKGRAAARWRELKRELELAEQAKGELYDEALTKINRLDGLAARYRRVREKLVDRGLTLAKGYEQRELPTMALEIARRMSAQFSMPAALDYYIAVARRTGKTLARWRLAYNERSLDGWSGGEDAFKAYGAQIRAGLTATAEQPFLTQELACDVAFDADFSLETELQADEGTKLVGLCFGRKDGQNLHAVMLHPKGFLDIVTKRGGVFEVLDHRSAPVGKDWHKLRIDVIGKVLDVYYDGYYVRSLEFPSAAALRGGFGLITGAGQTRFRRVRILGRDRHDPAAAIERKLAMERIAADAGLRQPGTFSGIAPPELSVAEWVQGERTTMAALKGRPVALAFWSPSQDRVIPTAALLADIVRRGKAGGLEVVVVCSAGTEAGALRDYLKQHPIPGARIALDSPSSATLAAYWVKKGGHGMPRVLLVDRKGHVAFEGDPGLRSGRGWAAGDPTYLDEPLARLLAADG